MERCHTCGDPADFKCKWCQLGAFCSEECWNHRVCTPIEWDHLRSEDVNAYAGDLCAAMNEYPLANRNFPDVDALQAFLRERMLVDATFREKAKSAFKQGWGRIKIWARMRTAKGVKNLETELMTDPGQFDDADLRIIRNMAGTRGRTAKLRALAQGILSERARARATATTQQEEEN